MVSAQEKPTGLRHARAAIEANISTAEGKTYDERFGTEFGQKHLGTLRQCKQSDGIDLTSFWMRFKLDKDGSVREMLLYPETKVGFCVLGNHWRKTVLRLSPVNGLSGECVHATEVSSPHENGA